VELNDADGEWTNMMRNGHIVLNTTSLNTGFNLLATGERIRRIWSNTPITSYPAYFQSLAYFPFFPIIIHEYKNMIASH